MAKRGAPLGNNNGGKNKIWTLAIEKAIEKRSKGKADQLQALIELADCLLDKCFEKDMTALRELGDRLEGKPMQSVEMNVTRTQSDMDDAELARIISADRSSRTPGKKDGQKEPDTVH